MPPHRCMLTVYLNRIFVPCVLKNRRAGKNLAGGSLKYLLTCLRNRICKKRCRNSWFCMDWFISTNNNNKNNNNKGTNKNCNPFTTYLQQKLTPPRCFLTPPPKTTSQHVIVPVVVEVVVLVQSHSHILETKSQAPLLFWTPLARCWCLYPFRETKTAAPCFFGHPPSRTTPQKHNPVKTSYLGNQRSLKPSTVSLTLPP